jgi:hypothetical protein
MRLRILSLSAMAIAGTLIVAACGPRPTGGGGGSSCGNRRVDRSEQCDGTALRGNTCATATRGAKPYGTLRCSNQCRFDTSACMASGSGGTGGTGGSTAGTGGVSTGGTGGVSTGGTGGVSTGG